MSFIQNQNGVGYTPGYFLGHEECVRKTQEIPTSMATTAADGSKYVPMGTIYPSADAYATGIVYEDVDVSTGNMPGSVVEKGVVIEGRLPQAVPTYDTATVTSADNPTTKGWYEKGSDDSYSASSDTVAQRGKDYYTRSGSDPDYTYTKVTTIEYGDNPKALGLYESDGQATPTYTLSEDTQADGSKTYYEFLGNKLGSTVKNALIALGFSFVDEPVVTRPY